MHNYFSMATDITPNCQEMHNSVYNMLYKIGLNPWKSVFYPSKTWELQKLWEMKTYSGMSRALYFTNSVYTLLENRRRKESGKHLYMPEGYKWKQDDLMFRNAYLLSELYKYPVRNWSIEYNDNQVSLFSAFQFLILVFAGRFIFLCTCFICGSFGRAWPKLRANVFLALVLYYTQLYKINIQ